MAKQTKNHKYKVGDFVKVYEDPITKKNLEGKAQILKCCDVDDYYKVEFQDEQGGRYYRFIY